MKLGRRPLVLVGVVALALAGCGSSSDDPGAVLRRAASQIGQIRAGNLFVRFTLAPNVQAATNTVGLVIHGSFALDPHYPLPVLHITYTRLAGTRSTSVLIDSTGRSATIAKGGQRAALTSRQQQELAAVLKGPAGLGNLPFHLDRWVAHPTQTAGPRLGGLATDRIAGTIDLPATLTDLNQLSGGQVGQAGLSTAASNALTKTIRASTFVALVGRADHLLRRLSVRIVLVPPISPTPHGLPKHGLTVVLDVVLTPRPLPH